MADTNTWWRVLLTNITPQQKRSRMMRDELHRLVTDGGTTGRHTGAGATLSYFITGLEEAGVPYTLHAFPGIGYMIYADREKPFPFLPRRDEDDAPLPP